jgi:hypothetical protein
MVGRGIVRIAKSQGITDIVEVTSKTCDLRNLQKTRELLLDIKFRNPDGLQLQTHVLFLFICKKRIVNYTSLRTSV